MQGREREAASTPAALAAREAGGAWAPAAMLQDSGDHPREGISRQGTVSLTGVLSSKNAGPPPFSTNSFPGTKSTLCPAGAREDAPRLGPTCTLRKSSEASAPGAAGPTGSAYSNLESASHRHARPLPTEPGLTCWAPRQATSAAGESYAGHPLPTLLPQDSPRAVGTRAR